MKDSNKIRVGIGGLFHETNTYATELTGPTTLKDLVVYEGEALLKLAGTAMGGAIDACLENDWEIVPTVFMHVNTTFGTVTDDAYAAVKQQLLSTLANEPVDVFYLMVHGAGIVQSTSDLEGDLAKSIREVVGVDTKIVASTDLHGKVTDLIAREYDYYTTCKEYAHVDFNPCAKEALLTGVSAFLNQLTPTMNYQKIPILLPPSTTMEAGTFGTLIRDKCLAYEENPQILNCSVMHGFPYQDTEYCGMYVLVTTDNDIVLAEQIATEFAQWIWDNRQLSLNLPPNVDQTIAITTDILATKGRYQAPAAFWENDNKPIVIADIGDNPGGGCTGDTTHLLSKILTTDLGKVAFFNIRDPQVVKQAIEAGVGATISVNLGGKLDPLRSGNPIACTAYVKSISDGIETIRGPMLNGVSFDLGPSVRLTVGQVDVIVQTGLGQAFDDVSGRAHGIDIYEYDVVCVKSSAHWRAFYQKVSDHLLMADSPGLTTARVGEFAHTKLTHPIYPIDNDASFPISA
ncbi:M81 family metallopeptidase [Shewanella sp. 10N.286.51.B2]|uniref:M81 family metallopeptidase n=1 Tax=Shewanella sp. 10N.286.51.B2 TaxID=3229707 RepID=UPI00355014D9